MAVSARAVAIVLLVAVASGCASYRSVYHVRSLHTLVEPERRDLARGQGEPDYRIVEKMSEEAREMYRKGYVMLGYSQFVSPLHPNFSEGSAKITAERLGASAVRQLEPVPASDRNYSYLVTYWSQVESFVLGAYFDYLPPVAFQRMGCEANWVMVSEVVEGTPARAAGIEPGDLLVAFEGEPVTSPRQLGRKLQEHAGRTVQLTTWRGESPRELKVTLGALPETNATRGPLPEEFVRKQAASSERFLLGIALREESGGEGVLVQAVSPETQACAGGLVPGDVIRGLAGEPIGGYEQLLAVLGRARGQSDVALEVSRDGAPVGLRVNLGVGDPPESQTRLALLETRRELAPWLRTQAGDWTWIIKLADAAGAVAKATGEIARQMEAERQWYNQRQAQAATDLQAELDWIDRQYWAHCKKRCLRYKPTQSQGYGMQPSGALPKFSFSPSESDWYGLGWQAGQGAMAWSNSLFSFTDYRLGKIH